MTDWETNEIGPEAKLKEEYCGFCGKSVKDIEYLIYGDNSSICNECIDFCRDIVGHKRLDKVRKIDKDNGQ